MTESKLRDISTDFAVKIIKLCETIIGYSFATKKELLSTKSSFFVYPSPVFERFDKVQFVNILQSLLPRGGKLC